MPTDEFFDQLEDQQGRRGATIDFKPPVTDEELAEYAANHPAHPLPADLVKLVRRHNGFKVDGSGGILTFVPLRTFMSRDEAISAGVSVDFDYVPADAVFLSRHDNSDGFYLLLADSGKYAWLTQGGASTDFGTDIRAMLEDLWNAFVKPPRIRMNGWWRLGPQDKRPDARESTSQAIDDLATVGTDVFASLHHGGRASIAKVSSIGYKSEICSWPGAPARRIIGLRDLLLFCRLDSPGELSLYSLPASANGEVLPTLIKTIKVTTPRPKLKAVSAQTFALLSVEVSKERHELWRTDATPKGTKRVGAVSGKGPRRLVVQGDIAYILSFEGAVRAK